MPSLQVKVTHLWYTGHQDVGICVTYKIHCSIQIFFGHTVFLKLRIGLFSDAQKLSMVVTECPKIFAVQCFWGRIFVSLEKVFVIKYS